MMWGDAYGNISRFSCVFHFYSCCNYGGDGCTEGAVYNHRRYNWICPHNGTHTFGDRASAYTSPGHSDNCCGDKVYKIDFWLKNVDKCLRFMYSFTHSEQ